MPNHNHGWGYATTGTKGNNEWSSAGSNKTGTANDIIQFPKYFKEVFIK